MIVLKEGELPNDPVWHGTCDYCECLLEANTSELDKLADDLDHMGTKCPTDNCGNYIKMYKGRHPERNSL